MLSKTCKYALRAIIYIAKSNVKENKIRIKEITEKIDVPTHFLAKILQNLVKEGLMSSTKGPLGGFYIDRPLCEMTLLDVVKVVEGKEYLEYCLLKNEPCDCMSTTKRHCPLHESFCRAKQEIRRFYQETTLYDIVMGMEIQEDLISL
ncbi:MAG: RrF2 family transcriptional regulator [Mangrovibacterium sp.]